MSSETLLVVDDEPAVRSMVSFALRQEGFAITEAGNATEALAQLAIASPCLILMDWMMPGISGVDLTHRLKRRPDTRDIPIILVSAKADEEERIHGLEAGADDYITKPFSTRELAARIRAVLRRGTRRSEDTENLSAGGLTLNMSTCRIYAKGAEIELSPMEFKLLHFFLANPERVHSRAHMLDQVWGETVYIDERTVDVHIRRLRKVLTPFGCDTYIQTVRRNGYRFSTTV
jgi:two-component system phosphate regulon response regulator PhoB